VPFRLACEVDAGDGELPLPERDVQTLVAAALYEAGAPDGDEIELGVHFVDLERIADLNDEHREVDGPTDVLSFPIDGLVEDVPPGMPRQLGDVVICVPYVERQVEEGLTMQGDPTLAEAIERCIVHGVLHLAGFDHERGEAAATEMFALEQQILDRVRNAR
jgi:rRNA maturation RNase YbeY